MWGLDTYRRLQSLLHLSIYKTAKIMSQPSAPCKLHSQVFSKIKKKILKNLKCKNITVP